MENVPVADSMDARLMQLEHQGYTVVPGAIAPAPLAAMRRRFDELIAGFDKIPSAVRTPATGSIDINRLLEVDPVFSSLIDLPTVLPYVERLQGGDVRLLGASMANFMPGHSPARCGWHHDGGPYTRLTFLLSDLTEDGGPTAVVPGSHRKLTDVPAWCNDAGGQPRVLPGMVKVTGRAGDCMINNTHVWHTSTPNLSDEPRRIVWVVYKREAQDMPPPSQYNLLHTPEFFAREKDAKRRRLMELAVVPRA